LTPAASAGDGATTKQLLDEINRIRAVNGLPAMRADWRLKQAARLHSNDMLRKNYFGHQGFMYRIRRVRARGPHFSENIAMVAGSTTNARLIVQMWMDSPPHRANLLRFGFRRIGLSALVGPFLGEPSAAVVTAEFAGR
jgi:uncharacterized protein YkwD